MRRKRGEEGEGGKCIQGAWRLPLGASFGEEGRNEEKAQRLTGCGGGVEGGGKRLFGARKGRCCAEEE